jgi:uncharacterized protein
MLCSQDMNQSLQIGDLVEVQSLKWPNRLTGIAQTRYLGQDEYGIWLGIRRGDVFWLPDRSVGGTMVQTFVKLMPINSYWTALFQDIEPYLDIDISYPVNWTGQTVQELDLELDILRYTDGRVVVRDQDDFAELTSDESVPREVIVNAESTCAKVLELLESDAEPFRTVGLAWLANWVSRR